MTVAPFSEHLQNRSAAAVGTSSAHCELWSNPRASLLDCVFSGSSYLPLADHLGGAMRGVIGRAGGRRCGHSAAINCHWVYDSAVAERLLSVHYHSSIAFSDRDVRPPRRDLSQTR